MPNTPSKYRSAYKNITFSLGIATTIGDLVSPTESYARKQDALVSICPECAEPHKVSQFYRCNEDEAHGPFTVGDLAKAKETDEGFVRLSAAQVEAARTSELPKNYLDLRVHNRAEVQSKTVPSGNSYVFRPTSQERLVGLVVDFLKNNQDYVLMGVVNIRNSDKLMQLSVGMNDQLMFRELTWPEDLRSFEDPSYDLDPALRTSAETIIVSSVTEFNPDEYKKQARDRMNRLVEMVAQGDEPAVVTPKAKKDDGDDLDAMLRASIAALGS